MHIVPLTLRVELAGALLGLSRPSSYCLAKSGKLPMAPIPGRKKVITAEFARMFGIELTLEQIRDAERRIAAAKQHAASRPNNTTTAPRIKTGERGPSTANGPAMTDKLDAPKQGHRHAPTKKAAHGC